MHRHHAPGPIDLSLRRNQAEPGQAVGRRRPRPSIERGALEVIRCKRRTGGMADVQDHQIIRPRRIEDEEWKTRRRYHAHVGTLL
jgi:hypothetical protein